MDHWVCTTWTEMSLKDPFRNCHCFITKSVLNATSWEITHLSWLISFHAFPFSIFKVLASTQGIQFSNFSHFLFAAKDFWDVQSKLPFLLQVDPSSCSHSISSPPSAQTWPGKLSGSVRKQDEPFLPQISLYIFLTAFQQERKRSLTKVKDLSTTDMQVSPKKDLEGCSHRIHSCQHCGHNTPVTAYSHHQAEGQGFENLTKPFLA